MTLRVSQQLTVRDRYLAGETISGIASDLGVDRKTVRKYATREDFSEAPPVVRRCGFPSLDPWKGFIDGLLVEDQRSWRKQKLTAKRVWDLARQEGCTVSQSTVERYVRQWRQVNTVEREPMLELEWVPGEGQVDFGQADVIEGSAVVRRHFLVVSFPHSNMGYLQFFGGETAECVCQGLADVFARIGGVPTRLVFDNATGVGKRRGEEVVETELFSRFRTHYGFDATFCNPASGNEKGNVENKVGYLRRNLLTPLLEIAGMETANEELLGACEGLQFSRVHYKHDQTIRDLFEGDQAALRPLPRAAFQAVSYQVMRTDRYGAITIGKHHYSGDPSKSLVDVVVCSSAHRVELLDGATHEVLASHARLWGDKPSSSIDVVSQLRVLTIKGRGWTNTVIRSKLPENLVGALDQMGVTPRRHAIKDLADSIEENGLEATLEAVTQVQGRKGKECLDFTAVGALAARINGYGLDPTPLPGPDLGVYDMLKAVS